MTLGELCADLVARIIADLRTRYPDAEGRLKAERPGDLYPDYLLEIDVGGTLWSAAYVGLDRDDPEVVSRHEAQKTLCERYEAVINNVWPDEDPWPLCPEHGDHPLQPRLVAGVASWACRLDDRISVPLGSLASAATSLQQGSDTE